jgi:LPS-assembly protein
MAAAGAVLACAFATPALAQGLIPPDFFTASPNPNSPTAVEANNLVFDASSGIITASGDVVLKQGGYTVTGESLIYNRRTGDARFNGAVSVTDPSGNVIETHDLEVTGEMKQAFLNSLAITTYDGARITADSADYDRELQTLLTNATYAPCGDCIDDQGRRIGWSVSASKVVYNAEDGSVYLEQPSLALLGIPVAWLPFFWLPDTSDTALDNVRMPNFSYSEETGARLEVPVAAYTSRWTDIILTPTLLTRQGFLMGAEWIQRFDRGQFQVKASGLYQFDKSAFTYPDAQRDWRGALQTSGEFRPVEDWVVGWSYTAFTDNAYLADYSLRTAKSAVNEVYATHVTADTFVDARVQQFNFVGDVSEIVEQQQAAAIPNVRFEHILELADDMGRIEIEGRLLGVYREADTGRVVGGVPYTFGYEGTKQHASFQAGWQRQWIGAGGFVATPYIGGRADVAYYDGASAIGPGETTLWTATPIAALDVRYPLVANQGSTVHIVEPIAQLIYRGSGTTAVGITNDDAQSFVFDDTNLFSYNRFSGSDRQETGLRANIGGRYQMSLNDGGYVELIAGQSFHLAGVNAYDTVDQTQTGVGGGLAGDASFAILGAYGRFTNGFDFGGKLQIDNTDLSVARAGLETNFENDGWSAGLNYHFIAANEEAGVMADQHEIGAEVGVPVAEYWTVTGSADWNLATNSWMQVGAGLQYDDGYLVFGAAATRNGPGHPSPDTTRVLATFRLKAPAGLNVGVSNIGVPVPGL